MTARIVLSGHPKLKNDLRRPTMEEIGYRTTVFSFDNNIGDQQAYIDWLMNACSSEETETAEIPESSALKLIAAR